MADNSARHQFRISKIGSVARRGLADNAQGEIGAVFENSLYVVIGGQWICLAHANAGMGPLNALCVPQGIEISLGAIARVSDPAFIVDGNLIIKNSASFSLKHAEEWRPVIPVDWDARSLSAGLLAFEENLVCGLPDDGLAPLLLSDVLPRPLLPVSAAARAAAHHLRQMILTVHDCDQHHVDARPLMALLGLGPGLTPSGDDFIGGAMVTLHVLGLDELREHIHSLVRSFATAATNQISVAHLEAAASGYGSEALHAILNDILQGRGAAFAKDLHAIDEVGHTSGWDALVGVVTVLRAWLEARQRSAAVV